jgi:hypothetical protein
MFAMAITSIKRDIVAGPNWVKVTTTDDLATITTAGYLTTQEENIEQLQHGSFEWLEGDGVEIFYAGGTNTFTRDAGTNTFVLMNTGGGSGSIVTPTITDHIVVALDDEGTIGNILTNQNVTAKFNGVVQAGLAEGGNPGYFASYSNLGSLGGRFIFQGSGNIDGADTILTHTSHENSATYILPDTGAAEAFILMSQSLGTQAIETGNLRIDDGSMTVVNGSLVSRSALTGEGSLQIRHINSGGDFFVLIQNKVMGQNSTYTIPDIGITQGALVASPTPLVLDSFARVAIPGGNPTAVILDPNCTIDSIVVGNFVSGLTLTTVQQITPAAGQFLVTSEVDPGPCEFSYIIINKQPF